MDNLHPPWLKKEKDVNRQNADLHITKTSLTALEKTQ